jgi:hypothetical protein
MSHRTQMITVLLAMAAVASGCGTAAHSGSTATSSVPPPSLATSLPTATGTWAVVVMGGTAASHNNFWQLFTRPAAASTWRLVTPPGVASNGGLVLASAGTGPVVAGFRPSQDLANSPLATTHTNGATWTPAILDAGLADVPDALATAPSGGRLLALAQRWPSRADRGPAEWQAWIAAGRRAHLMASQMSGPGCRYGTRAGSSCSTPATGYCCCATTRTRPPGGTGPPPAAV